METDNRITIKNNFIEKELELILLCLNATLHQIDDDKIDTLCEGDLDWDVFKNLLINHRVLSVLYPVIVSKCRKYIRTPIFDDIHNLYVNNAIKNLYFTSILHRVLDFLTDNDIKVIPLKGPALAEELYGDINFRIFSDLDILVSKENAFKAFNILISNGFSPELTLSRKQFKDFQKTEDHIILFTNSSRVNIELHWELSGRYLSKPFSIKQLENNVVKGKLYSKTINRFSKEDLLVYLCVHGSKHSWCDLESIYLVATLLNSEKGLDWDRVFFLARDIYCYKKLLLGLLLAKFF